MSKVVPSQIPPLIGRCFPWAAGLPAKAPQTLQSFAAITVAAILGAVESVPDHLILLDADDFAEFVTAKAILTQALRSWERGPGIVGPNVSEDRGALPRYGHPIIALRDTMAKCPDEAPTTLIAGLGFLTDSDLRTELWADIARAENARNNGEFKSATVLAGSVVEALLWWALTVEYTKCGRTTDAAELRNVMLNTLITQAAAAGLIAADTTSSARLAQSYRNLIHQGRAQRLSQACDIGTAHGALAAVYAVVRDLGLRSW